MMVLFLFQDELAMSGPGPSLFKRREALMNNPQVYILHGP
jgi:hypothetical protein